MENMSMITITLTVNGTQIESKLVPAANEASMFAAILAVTLRTYGK